MGLLNLKHEERNMYKELLHGLYSSDMSMCCTECGKHVLWFFSVIEFSTSECLASSSEDSFIIYYLTQLQTAGKLDTV